MNFSKLNVVNFEDLIPGNKYYIEKSDHDGHPGTGQQYGIFDRFEGNEDEVIYAVFNQTYDFKNKITDEHLRSSIGTGPGYAYRSKFHFIFYEPHEITYNKKQNEFLGKVMEQITNDTYMGHYISKQCWLSLIK